MKTTKVLILLAVFLVFVQANEISNQFIETCDDIISYSNGRNVNELLLVNYTTFPYDLNYIKQCDTSTNECLLLQTYNNFSCVVYNFTTKSYDPIDCNTKIFPLCAGRVSYQGACDSIDCCVTMNNIIYYNYNSTNAPYGSYHYSLQYYSGNGGEINCESFSSGTKDYCIQYLYYGASSDYSACSEWEKIRDGNSADDFSFSLF